MAIVTKKLIFLFLFLINLSSQIVVTISDSKALQSKPEKFKICLEKFL